MIIIWNFQNSFINWVIDSYKAKTFICQNQFQKRNFLCNIYSMWKIIPDLLYTIITTKLKHMILHLIKRILSLTFMNGIQDNSMNNGMLIPKKF